MIRSCRICTVTVRPRKNYTPNFCEACQKFFRRNVARHDKLVCTSGQFKCNVGDGRRCCSKCRFVKCLKQGMKSKFLNNPTTTTTTTTTTTSEASTSSSFSCIPENVCEISNGNSNLVILPVSRRRYSHG